MAVNESVYGAANTWANAYYQQNSIVNKNKIANFGDNTYTLAQGVSKGKLSYTEGIDKSISFCGLGEESALSHIAFIARTSSNTAAVLTENERFATNFGFFERVDNSMIFTSTDYRTNETNKYVWGNYSNTDNFTKSLRPLTVVNPHNLVLCIYVRCGQAGYNNTENMTLKTYLQSYTQSRPRIYKVWVQPYFGDTIPRLTEAGQGTPEYRKPLQIGLLDEYDFSAKNLKFNSYQLQTNNVVFGSFASGDYFYNIAESFAVVAFTPNSREHLKVEYNNDLYFPYFDYYEGFEEDILKTVACFGLYFTTDSNVAQNGALTNNDMYIGLLDENGIGHGQYLRGADTVNAPQNEFTDMSQSGYDYTKEVDKTKYKNDTEFYDSTLANGFTRFWVLDANGVSQVLNEMYDIMNDVDPDEPIERYSQKVFLTNNPIDCIISLKKFPVLHIPSLSGAYFVNFGSKATSISAYPLSKSCETYTFNFSAANDTSLYPVFGGDFRDFEPYTKCEIVIPFCGSVDVPCCYFYEYGGITVKLTIDFISGACTGFVLANGITISSVSGNCAIDLPVSGIQSATLDSQIFSAAQAKKQNFNKTRAGLVASALTATAGAITGNPVMIAAGAAGVLATAVNSKETVKNIDYELQHLQTPYKEVSTASGQISQSFDMRCKLIITRPKMLNYDENAYAETVGYACLNSGSVDSFHGLTYGTIELNGVPCTADEKSYIESMFANGVHLPTTYP